MSEIYHISEAIKTLQNEVKWLKNSLNRLSMLKLPLMDVGASFPASPPTGLRYYRTDLNLECTFDGTRWLGPEESGGFYTYVASSNQAPGSLALASWMPPSSGCILTSASVGFFLATVNNATNYWTFTIDIQGYGATLFTYSTGNGNGGAADTTGTDNNRPMVAGATTVLGANTPRGFVRAVSTLSPSNLQNFAVEMRFRRIYT
ncbi:MAG: hypothetical protein NVS9B9_17250 [Ktedonobacteraceae bacterium]